MKTLHPKAREFAVVTPDSTRRSSPADCVDRILRCDTGPVVASLLEEDVDCTPYRLAVGTALGTVLSSMTTSARRNRILWILFALLCRHPDGDEYRLKLFGNQTLWTHLQECITDTNSATSEVRVGMAFCGEMFRCVVRLRELDDFRRRVILTLERIMFSMAITSGIPRDLSLEAIGALAQRRELLFVEFGVGKNKTSEVESLNRLLDVGVSGPYVFDAMIVLSRMMKTETLTEQLRNTSIGQIMCKAIADVDVAPWPYLSREERATLAQHMAHGLHTLNGDTVGVLREVEQLPRAVFRIIQITAEAAQSRGLDLKQVKLCAELESKELYDVRLSSMAHVINVLSSIENRKLLQLFIDYGGFDCLIRCLGYCLEHLELDSTYARVLDLPCAIVNIIRILLLRVDESRFTFICCHEFPTMLILTEKMPKQVLVDVLRMLTIATDFIVDDVDFETLIAPAIVMCLHSLIVKNSLDDEVTEREAVLLELALEIIRGLCAYERCRAFVAEKVIFDPLGTLKLLLFSRPLYPKSIRLGVCELVTVFLLSDGFNGSKLEGYKIDETIHVTDQALYRLVVERDNHLLDQIVMEEDAERKDFELWMDEIFTTFRKLRKRSHGAVMRDDVVSYGCVVIGALLETSVKRINLKQEAVCQYNARHRALKLKLEKDEVMWWYEINRLQTEHLQEQREEVSRGNSVISCVSRHREEVALVKEKIESRREHNNIEASIEKSDIDISHEKVIAQDERFEQKVLIIELQMELLSGVVETFDAEVADLNNIWTQWIPIRISILNKEAEIYLSDTLVSEERLSRVQMFNGFSKSARDSLRHNSVFCKDVMEFVSLATKEVQTYGEVGDVMGWMQRLVETSLHPMEYLEFPPRCSIEQFESQSRSSLLLLFVDEGISILKSGEDICRQKIELEMLETFLALNHNPAFPHVDRFRAETALAEQETQPENRLSFSCVNKHIQYVLDHAVHVSWMMFFDVDGHFNAIIALEKEIAQLVSRCINTEISFSLACKSSMIHFEFCGNAISCQLEFLRTKGTLWTGTLYSTAKLGNDTLEGFKRDMKTRTLIEAKLQVDRTNKIEAQHRVYRHFTSLASDPLFANQTAVRALLLPAHRVVHYERAVQAIQYKKVVDVILAAQVRVVRTQSNLTEALDSYIRTSALVLEPLMAPRSFVTIPPESDLLVIQTMERRQRCCIQFMSFTSLLHIIKEHFLWCFEALDHLEVLQRFQLTEEESLSWLEMMKKENVTKLNVITSDNRNAMSSRYTVSLKNAEDCLLMEGTYITFKMSDLRKRIEDGYSDITVIQKNELKSTTDKMKRSEIQSTLSDIQTLSQRDARRCDLLQHQIQYLLNYKKEDLYHALCAKLDLKMATEEVRLSAQFNIATNFAINESAQIHQSLLKTLHTEKSHVDCVRLETLLISSGRCDVVFAMVQGTWKMLYEGRAGVELQSEFRTLCSDAVSMEQREKLLMQQRQAVCRETCSRLIADALTSANQVQQRCLHRIISIGGKEGSSTLDNLLNNRFDLYSTTSQQCIDELAPYFETLNDRLNDLVEKELISFEHFMVALRKCVSKDVNLGKLFVLDPFQSIVEAVVTRLEDSDTQVFENLYALDSTFEENFRDNSAECNVSVGLISIEYTENIERTVLQSGFRRKCLLLGRELIQYLVPCTIEHEGTRRSLIDLDECEARAKILYDVTKDKRWMHERVGRKIKPLDGTIIPASEVVEDMHRHAHQQIIQVIQQGTTIAETTPVYAKYTQEVRTSFAGAAVFVILHICEILYDLCRMDGVMDGLYYVAQLRGERFDHLLESCQRQEQSKVQTLRDEIIRLSRIQVKKASAVWELLSVQNLHRRVRDKANILHKASVLRVQLREIALLRYELVVSLKDKSRNHDLMLLSPEYVELLSSMGGTLIFPNLETRLRNTVYAAGVSVHKRYQNLNDFCEQLELWMKGRAALNTEAKHQLSAAKLKTLCQNNVAHWNLLTRSVLAEEKKFNDNVLSIMANFEPTQIVADFCLQERQERRVVELIAGMTLYRYITNITQTNQKYLLLAWESTRSALHAEQYHNRCFIVTTRDISKKLTVVYADLRRLDEAWAYDMAKGQEFVATLTQALNKLNDDVVGLLNNKDCDSEVYDDVVLTFSGIESQIQAVIADYYESIEIHHKAIAHTAQTTHFHLHSQLSNLQTLLEQKVPSVVQSCISKVMDAKYPEFLSHLAQAENLAQNDAFDVDFLIGIISKSISEREALEERITPMRCVVEASLSIDVAPRSPFKLQASPRREFETIASPRFGPPPIQAQQQQYPWFTDSGFEAVIPNAEQLILQIQHRFKRKSVEDMSAQRFAYKKQLESIKEYVVLHNATKHKTPKDVQTAVTRLAFNIDIARNAADMNLTEPSNTEELENFESILRLKLEFESSDQYEKLIRPHNVLMCAQLESECLMSRCHVEEEEFIHASTLMSNRITERDVLEKMRLRNLANDKEKLQKERAYVKTLLDQHLSHSPKLNASLEPIFLRADDVVKEAMSAADFCFEAAEVTTDRCITLQSSLSTYEMKELANALTTNERELADQWRSTQRKTLSSIRKCFELERKKATLMGWKINHEHSMHDDHVARMRTKTTKQERDNELRRQIRERQFFTNEFNRLMEDIECQRQLTEMQTPPSAASLELSMNTNLRLTLDELSQSIHASSSQEHSYVPQLAVLARRRIQSVTEIGKVYVKHARKRTEVLTEWLSRLESTKVKVATMSGFNPENVAEMIKLLVSKQKTELDALMSSYAADFSDAHRSYQALLQGNHLMTQKLTLQDWESYLRNELMEEWQHCVHNEKVRYYRNVMLLVAEEETIQRQRLEAEEVYDRGNVDEEVTLDYHRSEMFSNTTALLKEKDASRTYTESISQSMIVRFETQYTQLSNQILKFEEQLVTKMEELTVDKREEIRSSFEMETHMVEEAFNRVIRMTRSLWMHVIVNNEREFHEKIAMERQSVKKIVEIVKEAEVMLRTYRSRVWQKVEASLANQKNTRLQIHLTNCRTEYEITKIYSNSLKKSEEAAKTQDVVGESVRCVKLHIQCLQRDASAVAEFVSKQLKTSLDIEDTWSANLQSFSDFCVQQLLGRAHSIFGYAPTSRFRGIVPCIVGILSEVITVPPELSWKFIPRRRVLIQSLEELKKAMTIVTCDICWDVPNPGQEWQIEQENRMKQYEMFSRAIQDIQVALVESWTQTRFELIESIQKSTFTSLTSIQHHQDFERDIIYQQSQDNVTRLQFIHLLFMTHSVMVAENRSRRNILADYLQIVTDLISKSKEEYIALRTAANVEGVHQSMSTLINQVDCVSHPDLPSADRLPWRMRVEQLRRSQISMIHITAARDKVISQLYLVKTSLDNVPPNEDNVALIEKMQWINGEAIVADHFSTLEELFVHEDVIKVSETHFACVFEDLSIVPIRLVRASSFLDNPKTLSRALSLSGRHMAKSAENTAVASLLTDRTTMHLKFSYEYEKMLEEHIIVEFMHGTESEWVFRAQMGLEPAAHLAKLRTKATTSLHQKQLLQEKEFETKMVEKLQEFDAEVMDSETTEVLLPYWESLETLQRIKLISEYGFELSMIAFTYFRTLTEDLVAREKVLREHILNTCESEMNIITVTYKAEKYCCQLLIEQQSVRSQQLSELEQFQRDRERSLEKIDQHHQRLQGVFRGKYATPPSAAAPEKARNQAQLQHVLETLKFSVNRERLQTEGEWTLIINEFQKESAEQSALLSSKYGTINKICKGCISLGIKENQCFAVFQQGIRDVCVRFCAKKATLMGRKKILEAVGVEFDNALIKDCDQQLVLSLQQEKDKLAAAITAERVKWYNDMKVVFRHTMSLLPDHKVVDYMESYALHVLQTVLATVETVVFHERSHKQLKMKMQQSRAKRDLVLKHLTQTSAIESEWVYQIEDSKERKSVAELLDMQTEMRNNMQQAKTLQRIEVQGMEELHTRNLVELQSGLNGNCSVEMLLEDVQYSEEDERGLIHTDYNDVYASIRSAFFQRLEKCLISTMERGTHQLAIEEKIERESLVDICSQSARLVTFDADLANLHVLYRVNIQGDAHNHEQILEEVRGLREELVKSIEKKYDAVRIGSSDASGFQKALLRDVAKILDECNDVCQIEYNHYTKSIYYVFLSKFASKSYARDVVNRKVITALQTRATVTKLLKTHALELSDHNAAFSIKIACMEAAQAQNLFTMENDHKHRFGLLKNIQSHREEAVRQVHEKSNLINKHQATLIEERKNFEAERVIIEHRHSDELQAALKSIKAKHMNLPQDTYKFVTEIASQEQKQQESMHSLLEAVSLGLYNEYTTHLRKLIDQVDSMVKPPEVSIIGGVLTQLNTLRQRNCPPLGIMAATQKQQSAQFLSIVTPDVQSPLLSPRDPSPFSSPRGGDAEWMYAMDELEDEHRAKLLRKRGNVVVTEVELLHRFMLEQEERDQFKSMVSQDLVWKDSFLNVQEESQRLTLEGEEQLAFHNFCANERHEAASVIELEEVNHQESQKKQAQIAVETGGNYSALRNIQKEQADRHAARTFMIQKKVSQMKTKANADRLERRLEVTQATRKLVMAVAEQWNVSAIRLEHKDQLQHLLEVHHQRFLSHLPSNISTALYEELQRQTKEWAQERQRLEQQLMECDSANIESRKTLLASHVAERSFTMSRLTRNQSDPVNDAADEQVLEMAMERSNLLTGYDVAVQKLKMEHKSALNTLSLKLRTAFSYEDAPVSPRTNRAYKVEAQLLFRKFLEAKFSAKNDLATRLKNFDLAAQKKYSFNVRLLEIQYREDVERYVICTAYHDYVKNHEENLLKVQTSCLCAQESANRRTIIEENEEHLGQLLFVVILPVMAHGMRVDHEAAIFRGRTSALREMRSLSDDIRQRALTSFELQMNRARTSKGLSSSELWTLLAKNKDRSLEPIVNATAQTFGVMHTLMQLFEHESTVHQHSSIQHMCVWLQEPHLCIPIAQEEFSRIWHHRRGVHSDRLAFELQHTTAVDTLLFMKNVFDYISEYWHEETLATVKSVNDYEIEMLKHTTSHDEFGGVIETQMKKMYATKDTKMKVFDTELSREESIFETNTSSILKRANAANTNVSTLFEFYEEFMSALNVPLDLKPTLKMEMARSSLEQLLAVEKQHFQNIQMLNADSNYLLKLEDKISLRANNMETITDSLTSSLPSKPVTNYEHVSVLEWEFMVRQVLVQDEHRDRSFLYDELFSSLEEIYTLQLDAVRDSVMRAEGVEFTEFLTKFAQSRTSIALGHQLNSLTESEHDELSKRELERAIEAATQRFGNHKAAILDHFKLLDANLENKFQLDHIKVECMKSERLSKARTPLEMEFAESEGKLQLESLQSEVNTARERLRQQSVREARQVDTDLELCNAVLEYSSSYENRESKRRRAEYEASQESLRKQAQDVMSLVPEILSQEKEKAQGFDQDMISLDHRWMWKCIRHRFVQFIELNEAAEELKGNLQSVSLSPVEKGSVLIHFIGRFANIIGCSSYEHQLERTVLRQACEIGYQRATLEAKKASMTGFEKLGVVFDKVPKGSVCIEALRHISGDVSTDTPAARARRLAFKLFHFNQTQQLRVHQLQRDHVQEMLILETRANSEFMNLNETQYHDVLSLDSCEDVGLKLRTQFYQRNETHRKNHQLTESTRVMHLQAAQSLDVKLEQDAWKYELTLLLELPQDEMISVFVQGEAVRRQNIVNNAHEEYNIICNKRLNFQLDRIVDTEIPTRSLIQEVEALYFEYLCNDFRVSHIYFCVEEDIRVQNRRKEEYCLRQKEIISDTAEKMSALQMDLCHFLNGDIRNRVQTELQRYVEQDVDFQTQTVQQYEADENSAVILKSMVLNEGALMVENIRQFLTRITAIEENTLRRMNAVTIEQSQLERVHHNNLMFALEEFDLQTSALISQSVAALEKNEEFKRRARDRAQLMEESMNTLTDALTACNASKLEIQEAKTKELSLLEEECPLPSTGEIGNPLEEAFISLKRFLLAQSKSEAGNLRNDMLSFQTLQNQKRKEKENALNEARSQLFSLLQSFVLLSETMVSEHDEAVRKLEESGATSDAITGINNEFVRKQQEVAKAQADTILQMLTKIEQDGILSLNLSSDDAYANESLSPRSRLLALRVHEQGKRDAINNEVITSRLKLFNSFFTELKKFLSVIEDNDRQRFINAENAAFSGILDDWETIGGEKLPEVRRLPVAIPLTFDLPAGDSPRNPTRKSEAKTRYVNRTKSLMRHANMALYPNKRRIPMLECYMEDSSFSLEDKVTMGVRNILLDEYLQRSTKEKQEMQFRNQAYEEYVAIGTKLKSWIERRRNMFWQVVGMQFLPGPQERSEVREALHHKDPEAVEWCENGGTFEELLPPPPPEIRGKMKPKKWKDVMAARQKDQTTPTKSALEQLREEIQQASPQMPDNASSLESSDMVSPRFTVRSPPPDFQTDHVLFRGRQLSEFRKKVVAARSLSPQTDPNTNWQDLTLDGETVPPTLSTAALLDLMGVPHSRKKVNMK